MDDDQQHVAHDALAARPIINDRDAWTAYWAACGQAWRTEPEIAPERQAYLAERRASIPDIKQGIYPFKHIEPALSRADIEWLLVTHDNGRGPVQWAEQREKPGDKRRVGLDLRGSDLQNTSLHGLPLTLLRAGLTFDEWDQATSEQRQQAAVQLEGVDLSGALLEEANLRGAQLARADLREAQLQGAILSEAQLEGASLSRAQLALASLSRAHVEGAILGEAQLQGANLSKAQLKGAILGEAQLQGASLFKAQLTWANLRQAQLQGADLREAQLTLADLREAQLQGAILREAQLQGADLSRAHVEGAILTKAQLEEANLTGASLDKATQLNDATFTRVSLDQTIFDNTNLSVVKWLDVPVLGDELSAQVAKDSHGARKSRQQRIDDYQAAVRAYRRLAVALQANGMSEEASAYLYRAQIMQRRLQWHSRQPGAYLFSVLLAVLAGYGYRLNRIAITYLVMVALFAGAYLVSGVLAGDPIGVQQVFDAAQISLNAIHGRVFFAQFHLDTLQSWLATIESVFGIVIEGVFVAMLIQRFFGQ